MEKFQSGMPPGKGGTTHVSESPPSFLLDQKFYGKKFRFLHLPASGKEMSIATSKHDDNSLGMPYPPSKSFDFSGSNIFGGFVGLIMTSENLLINLLIKFPGIFFVGWSLVEEIWLALKTPVEWVQLNGAQLNSIKLNGIYCTLIFYPHLAGSKHHWA